MRPVMPRWTIHCAASGRCGGASRRVSPRTALLPFFGCAVSSRSNTMCLPARCTRTIRLPSSVEAMTPAGDLSGCGLEPIQTDSTVSPAMRVSRPRAMVSTSGSSGTLSGYKISVAGQFGCGHFACELPLNSGLLLHGPIRYARAYTPSNADRSSSVFQSIQQRRNPCVRPWGGLRFAAAQCSKWSSN